LLLSCRTYSNCHLTFVNKLANMLLCDISLYDISWSSPSDMDVQAYLPLTETTYYILLSLAPGSRHGYAIMKEVRELSQGQVVLSTGTLYGALKRLLDLQWIERVDETKADGSRRVRKLYGLTQLGRRVLQAEVARLKILIHTAQAHSIEGSL